MKYLISTLFFVLSIGATASDIPGFSPEQDATTNGRAIADEAARRDDGFSDSQSAMTMTLFNGRGDSVVRRMRSRTLEMADDGDRTILFFEDPADVRGTAFLTHSHADKANDQWLYLPALRRVKRIAGNQRNGAFMSSEFSYEDLGNDEVDKYQYKYLGESKTDDVASYHLERVPTGNSGYSRQEIWLDQAELRILKVDYYDRSGALLKTLIAGQHEHYENRYWRPTRMEMSNVQNGRKTVLTWSDYRFKQGLATNDFSPATLDRTR